MKNKRIRQAPHLQFLHLYRVILIHFQRDSWNSKCDYYVKQGDYVQKDFILSKERCSKYPIQLGIIIKNDDVVPVLESIDFSPYTVKSIGRFHLTTACIHRGYNNAIKKYG